MHTDNLLIAAHQLTGLIYYTNSHMFYFSLHSKSQSFCNLWDIYDTRRLAKGEEESSYDKDNVGIYDKLTRYWVIVLSVYKY